MAYGYVVPWIICRPANHYNKRFGVTPWRRVDYQVNTGPLVPFGSNIQRASYPGGHPKPFTHKNND
jgi:hypothetical protein